MTKENGTSFLNRIKQLRQEADNQRQLNNVIHQQRQQHALVKQKEEDIKRQQEIQERIRRTKKNFEGTCILEVFQEIIYQNILTFGRYEEYKFKDGLFRTSSTITEKLISAKIQYSDKKVSLLYNAEYFSHSGEYDITPDYYSCSSLSLEMINDDKSKFTLSLPGQKNAVLGTNEEILERLAQYIFSTGSETHLMANLDRQQLEKYSRYLDENNTTECTISDLDRYQ